MAALPRRTDRVTGLTGTSSYQPGDHEPTECKFVDGPMGTRPAAYPTAALNLTYDGVGL